MATSYVAVGTAVNMIADSRYPPKKNPAPRAGLNQSQSKNRQLYRQKRGLPQPVGQSTAFRLAAEVLPPSVATS